MPVQIGIINGPNLNMLGKREKALYGHLSFEQYLPELQKKFPHIHLLYFQSNTEGLLIDKLQEWQDTMNGLIINAGAYTHTSIAIADCLAYTKIPVVEVHLTNIYARETYRRHSYLSPHCKAVIAGMGLNGYEYAVHFLLELLEQ